ncbi:MAG: lipid A deacylase LpxR family protein, partial [Sphingobacteriales bacterium]
GVYIELTDPSLRRFPLNRLTWKPSSESVIYGLAVETNGYTPNNIDRAEIQQGDRPYASTLLIRAFNTSISEKQQHRTTNTITAGVLGPWAGGREIQVSIHRWIGYTKPLGWHNQVRNEPALNYQLNYEKKILGDARHLLVTANGMARAGTLSSKAAVGIAVMSGSFQNPFVIPVTGSKSFYIHVYDQATLNLVGYDATLQGGLINRGSPYTIGAASINRVVFQNRFGLVLNYRSIMLEYWQSFITREYTTGIEPKTGGLQIAMRL